MGRVIQRTVIGGTAILLVVLVPSVQVLGAASDGIGTEETSEAIQKTRAAESAEHESPEEKESRFDENADLPEIEETRESGNGEKTESTSGAERVRHGERRESGR